MAEAWGLNLTIGLSAVMALILSSLVVLIVPLRRVP